MDLTVLIVNDYAHVNGGASKVALTSARALAARGVKTILFTAVGPVEDSLKGLANLQIICLNEKPYNESVGRRAIIAGLWDRGAQSRFAELFNGVPKGAIAHFHSYRDALSASLFRPLIEKAIPIVYTCHEYGIACPYAGFFDFKQDGICTRRALSASCLLAHCNQKGYDRKLWTYTKGAIQNKVLGLPSKLSDIVFVSEFSQKILSPYLGGKGRQHILRNPIDAPLGWKRKLRPESPFLFVGSLSYLKDPVLAARAAARAGVSIVFVGDGEAHEQVAKANPETVITGWQPPEEVFKRLLDARAVVLPSKSYETQGLVVQEAALLGVPAIVTRTSAACEAVRDGINGILIDGGAEDQLAEALHRLSDDAFACQLGEAAYASFWSDPPTLEKHIDGLMNIYEGALKHA